MSLSTESPVFASFARLMVRRRLWVLSGSVALTVALAGYAASHVTLDNSIEAFVDPTSEAARTNESLHEIFGNDIVYNIVVEGDVFSPDYVARLRRLQRDIESMDVELPSLGRRPAARDGAPEAPPRDDAPDIFGDEEGWGDEAGGSPFEEVTSILNARRTRSKDGGLEVGNWLAGIETAADLERIRPAMLADVTLRGRLLGEHARHSVVVLRTAFLTGDDPLRLHAALKQTLEKHRSAGFVPLLGGFHAVEIEQLEIALRDMAVLVALSLLVSLLTMGFVFRHPLGVLGPVFAVVEAIVAVLAAFALTGTAMTGLTTILPIFIVAVGLGDAVHIQSVYRDLRREGVDNALAIERALATTGPPILFTTLTTAAGLFSFYWASSPAVRELGMFAGVGIIAAMLGCITVVPAGLSFNRTSLFGARAPTGRRSRLDGFLAWCNLVSRGGRHRLVLVLLAAAGMGAMFAVSRLPATNDPIKDLPPEVEVRKATSQLDEHVGGAANLAILVDAAEGFDLSDPDVLLALEALERRVLAYRHPSPPLQGEPIVHNVSSILDVMRESWRATHDDDQAFYKLPDTQRGVSDMMTLFANTGPEHLKQLITVDNRTALMIARVRWMDSAGYKPLAAHVRSAIDEDLGRHIRVRVGGSVFSLLSTGDLIVADMVKSFLVAFVVIGLSMIVLLRSLKLGLLAVVPNLLPVALVLSGLQVLGLNLDFTVVLIGSTAIGIAVDDTIHFLYQYSVHFREHGDREAAISHAYAHSGRAMVITSVILVTGFSVYGVALANNVVRFGAMLGSIVILALLIDVICCPALLRAAYPQTLRLSD